MAARVRLVLKTKKKKGEGEGEGGEGRIGGVKVWMDKGKEGASGRLIWFEHGRLGLVV